MAICWVGFAFITRSAKREEAERAAHTNGLLQQVLAVFERHHELYPDARIVFGNPEEIQEVLKDEQEDTPRDFSVADEDGTRDTGGV